jgi:hypothetical protein
MIITGGLRPAPGSPAGMVRIGRVKNDTLYTSLSGGDNLNITQTDVKSTSQHQNLNITQFEVTQDHDSISRNLMMTLKNFRVIFTKCDIDNPQSCNRTA